MVKRFVPLRATTVFIGAVGMVENCLSLSYFTRERNRRNNQGLGNKLLILLNFCDLMVCFTALTTSLLYMVKDGKVGHYPYLVSSFIYMVSFDCTGFSTCLLSVTRMIKVCQPFFIIKENWVAASFMTYFFCSVLREFLCYYLFFIDTSANHSTVMNYYPLIFSLGTIVSVAMVSFSTIVTIYWLRQEKAIREVSVESSKYATKTVLILSTVFCSLNFVFITTGLLSFSVKVNLLKISESVIWYVRQIGGALPIVLNSAANPLVYIVRKEEMRKFVLEGAGKFRKCFGASKATNRERNEELSGRAKNHKDILSLKSASNHELLDA